MKFKYLAAAVLSVLSMQAYAQDEISEMSMSTSTGSMPDMTLGKPELSIFQFSAVATYANTGYSGIKGINGATMKDLQFPGGGMSVVVGKGKWQFESGLLFTTIGSETSYTDNVGNSLKLATQSSYIDVPALARWTVMGDRRYRLFVRGGAVGAFLVDSKVTTSGRVLSQALDRSSQQNSAFHDTDVRGMLGIGTAYRITPSIAMSAAVDYQEGLTKLTTSELYQGLDVHSRSLGVTLGLAIRI